MTITIQEVKPEQVHILGSNQETEVLSSDELDTLIKEIEQLQPSTVVATPKSQEQINQEALQILSTAQDKAHEQILTGTNEVTSIFYWGAGLIIVIGTLQLLAILAFKALKKQKAQQQ